MNCLYRRINSSINLYRSYRITQAIPTCLYHNVTNNIPKVNPNPTSNYTYSVIRYKSKKQQRDPDSDDEKDNLEYADDDFSLSRDSKVVKFHTTTLRTDLILKSALGVARNKIEQLFYESKIRINGKKLLKKSASIRQDYEIDIIKSVSSKNPNHIYVSRIIVLNIVPKDENIAVTVRRFKNLLIENYEEDPYKGMSEE